MMLAANQETQLIKRCQQYPHSSCCNKSCAHFSTSATAFYALTAMVAGKNLHAPHDIIPVRRTTFRAILFPQLLTENSLYHRGSYLRTPQNVVSLMRRPKIQKRSCFHFRELHKQEKKIRQNNITQTFPLRCHQKSKTILAPFDSELHTERNSIC